MWTRRGSILELYEAECQALLDEYAAGTTKGKRGKEATPTLSSKTGEKMGHPADGDSGGPRIASSEERVFERRRFPVLGAFDLCLKCSHLFNILDARGAISVTERVGVIARIRALAVGVAKAYVDQQKAEEGSAAASEENSSPKAEQLSAAGS